MVRVRVGGDAGRLVFKRRKADFWIWQRRISGGKHSASQPSAMLALLGWEREPLTLPRRWWASDEMSIFKSLRHCGDPAHAVRRSQ